MIIAVQTLLFFRESLLNILERFLRPFYQKLSLKFKGDEDSDEESEDEVFAEYDDERGVIFFPPVYAQRYAAVTDCLMDERWCGKLNKVVDFGYHDMSFIKYLKELQGINHILGVDIETIPLQCSSDLLGCDNYVTRRENPLQVTLFEGNAADPDYRLIGCDAVVAIEMIEHMLPHDLERLIHTIFGFIKPWVAIITTPNGDFNVLFKAMQKNGLRRMDHFFEWSREQFHDWCSNIVTRYPDYTVTTKGIGPGPPGTMRYGCCSQLALFVAKDYTKQPDLNLNSLALVAKKSNSKDLSHIIIGSWESPDCTLENNMLCAPPSFHVSVDSYPELLYDESSFTTIISSTPSIPDTMEYKDIKLQCNLESELGKNFLMFDDEMLFKILLPRPTELCRVYYIEDVACRLNCSTFEVKKFSKTTQNLMAKNKIDDCVHTREVVNEIRYLTKMLNFNKDCHETTGVRIPRQFEGTWSNFNWGANAPYWNQYYAVVREYSYPFEVKTDETRIIDLVTEEINRLVDTECEGVASNSYKLEIPIEQLMRVIEHITTDVDIVIQILEWNGYEIVDNVLVYSRLVADNIFDMSEEDDWQDDTVSDWDTAEVRSASYSDGSTIVPDFYGLQFFIFIFCLRRAIDQKVRKLKTLLTADKDITTELDRVVCRLMKLSLCTCKGRQNPPPISWMQCKLFDLLTLTEKSIERRRQRYSLKAIEYRENSITLCRYESLDQTVSRNLDQQPDLDIYGDLQNIYVDEEFDDYNVSIASNEYKEREKNYIQEESMNNINIDFKELNNICNMELQETDRLDKCNLKLVPYVFGRSLIKSRESICTTFNGDEKKQDIIKDDSETSIDKKDNVNSSGVVKILKTLSTKQSKGVLQSKHNLYKTSRAKINKRVASKKSSYFNLLKYDYSQYKKYKSKERKEPRENEMFQSTPSRPIPAGLIDFCQSQSIKKINTTISSSNMNKQNQLDKKIADTEEFMFIGIVTEEGEETLAMRRNIGTSPELDLEILETEGVLESVINLSSNNNSFCCNPVIEMEKFGSQTIFLHDLDEPSTSKGIRHFSTDVQCGPDFDIDPLRPENTSVTKVSQFFSAGIKIAEPCAEAKRNTNTSDFSSCMEKSTSVSIECKTSLGIKIKESIPDVTNDLSMIQVTENKLFQLSSEFSSFDPLMDIKQLNPVSLKINNSRNVYCDTVNSCFKSQTYFSTSYKNTSDIQIQSVSNEKNSVIKILQASDKTNLVCGGTHVHSFKEKQTSEDVVYQGQWQRKQSSFKINRCSKVRKIASLPKRQMLHLKPVDNNNRCSKKTISITSPKMTIRKQEPSNNAAQSNNIFLTVKTRNKNNTNKKMVPKVAGSSNVPKNTKTIYTARKPTSVSVIETPLRKERHQENKTNKNYLPLYLRRKIQNSITEEDKSEKKKDIFTNEYLFSPSKAREVAKDLIEISEKSLISNLNNYVIFRNEVQRENDPNTESSLATGINKNNSIHRSHSPQSQHSSNCSSPNSVSTVRDVCTRNRNSTSSERSSSGVLEIENRIAKTKKFTRRSKNNKKTVLSTVLCDNKENVPESSKNTITSNKNKEKSATSVFLRKTKSIIMAQMTTETSTLPLSSTTVSKTKITPFTKPAKLGNVNSANVNDQTYEKPSSSIFEKSLDNDSKNIDIICNSFPKISDNKVIIYETLKESALENNFLSNISIISNAKSWNSQQRIHKTTSSLMSAIRTLIESKTNEPEKSYDRNDSDSETVILSRDDNYFEKCRNNSPQNEETTTTHEVPCASETDIDTPHIHSPRKAIEKVAPPNIADIGSSYSDSDALSVKSFASASTSKFSEYYLADNELENTLPQTDTLNISSIQDLFERKEFNTIPNAGGMLAIQAFSGFSVNGPTTGDQPDFVNFIDSETGSFSFGTARQATSEEIFVSGRSSDTYESCDDAFVPNWLYSIISQHPSALESEAEENNLPISLPIVEPGFDLNGNVMEPGVGVGAGAGDGRGMHSDHSQDSSGHGTSLSSSEVSSEPQSEAMLTDPSTYTTQADQSHESMYLSAITDAPSSSRPEENTLPNTADNSGENASNGSMQRVVVHPRQITSDNDADISSFETDAVDSDNNNF
ncbi:uncharacterized protein LOC112054307 [Bicyclus anynana]|uniref:Small RNA 2'-O-methyltransferase n=1 Tax=Bicyclus anynana TaxID=110368 RepID=A0ABM3M7W4_BICAN|nr:uncharacterized protein LOC112054307 [Bicyclus anynana]